MPLRNGLMRSVSRLHRITSVYIFMCVRLYLCPFRGLLSTDPVTMPSEPTRPFIHHRIKCCIWYINKFLFSLFFEGKLDFRTGAGNRPADNDENEMLMMNMTNRRRRWRASLNTVVIYPFHTWILKISARFCQPQFLAIDFWAIGPGGCALPFFPLLLLAKYLMLVMRLMLHLMQSDDVRAKTYYIGCDHASSPKGELDDLYLIMGEGWLHLTRILSLRWIFYCLYCEIW